MNLKYIGRKEVSINFNKLYLKQYKKRNIRKDMDNEKVIDILFDDFTTYPKDYLKRLYGLDLIELDEDLSYNTPLIEILKGYLEFLNLRISNRNTKSIFSYSIRVLKEIEVCDFSKVYQHQIRETIESPKLIQEFEDNLEYYLREIFNIDINPQDGVPYEIWPEWVDAYEKWLKN